MAQGVGSLWKAEQSVVFSASGAGSLWSAEQSVVKSAAGSLWKAEQSVVFSASGAGSLWSAEQSVKATAAGSLWRTEQTVVDLAQTTHVDRFGFDLTITIDAAILSARLIHGSIDVTRSENGAALMNITIINQVGTLDLNRWRGKNITLDLQTKTGIARAYTGTVDIPEFDLVNKLITLRCTDKRNELINNQLASQLPFIGRWSSDIFQDPDDVAEELSQRLQTTTKTVDFDAYGNYQISDFLAKTTPDFVLDDADIYRRNPTLQVASRGRLINQVNLDFEFRYVRLRHRERSFQLDGPSFCEVSTTFGLSFINVESIENNIESFGWPVNQSSVSYDYLPPAGRYNCGQGFFFWSPFSRTVRTNNKTDGDGKEVTDSNGNAIVEVTGRTVTDFTRAFATSAMWRAARQFAQNISQKSTIQINAPQSQSQYGIIANMQQNSRGVEFDAAEFEKNDRYQPAPANFTGSDTDSFADQYGSIQDYASAINTAIDIAKTKIIKSHRDNTVTIQVPLWPGVSLTDTIELASALIQCRGKVSQIRHFIDITTRDSFTQITLSLSQAEGAQADDAFNVPIVAAPLSGDDYSGTFNMRTFGPYQPGLGGGQNIAKEIGIVTPSIDDASRNRQETQANYSFDIGIRNDLLQVVY